MSVDLLEGLIWFSMPLIVAWLISLISIIIDRKFQKSHYFAALLIGFFLLLFGPRCLCVDPMEVIFGSLLYSFISSVFSMLLFLGVKGLLSRNK